MTYRHETDVLIAGGGLTGMTAGLALAREGIQVTVIEPHATIPADRWGMTLWPTGVSVLRSLGLYDRVLKGGRRLDYLKWFVEKDYMWVAADLRILGANREFIGISPSQLQHIVAEEAVQSSIQVVRQAQVSQVQPRNLESCDAKVQLADGQQQTFRCRVVVIADGASSYLREVLGIKARIWRPYRQRIVTGIGSGVSFAESRQAFSNRWSGGCVSLGDDKTWLYAVIPSDCPIEYRSAIERYAEIDPEVKPAFAGLQEVNSLFPLSVRVSRWTCHTCVMVGDSAHSMLPYLGLGGNANLEDILVLAELLRKALRGQASIAAALHELQRRRQARISYLRRVSEFFSLCLTSPLPGSNWVRDWNFRRLARRPYLLERFLNEVSAGAVPSLCTRLSMLLP